MELEGRSREQSGHVRSFEELLPDPPQAFGLAQNRSGHLSSTWLTEVHKPWGSDTQPLFEPAWFVKPIGATNPNTPDLFISSKKVIPIRFIQGPN